MSIHGRDTEKRTFRCLKSKEARECFTGRAKNIIEVQIDFAGSEFAIVGLKTINDYDELVHSGKIIYLICSAEMVIFKHIFNFISLFFLFHIFYAV